MAPRGKRQAAPLDVTYVAPPMELPAWLSYTSSATLTTTKTFTYATLIDGTPTLVAGSVTQTLAGTDILELPLTVDVDSRVPLGFPYTTPGGSDPTVVRVLGQGRLITLGQVAAALPASTTPPAQQPEPTFTPIQAQSPQPLAPAASTSTSATTPLAPTPAPGSPSSSSTRPAQSTRPGAISSQGTTQTSRPVSPAGTGAAQRTSAVQAGIVSQVTREVTAIAEQTSSAFGRSSSASRGTAAASSSGQGTGATSTAASSSSGPIAGTALSSAPTAVPTMPAVTRSTTAVFTTSTILTSGGRTSTVLSTFTSSFVTTIPAAAASSSSGSAISTAASTTINPFANGTAPVAALTWVTRPGLVTTTLPVTLPGGQTTQSPVTLSLSIQPDGSVSTSTLADTIAPVTTSPPASSATEVTNPTLTPANLSAPKKLSPGGIAGVSLGVAAFAFFLIFLALCLLRRRKQRKSRVWGGSADDDQEQQPPKDPWAFVKAGGKMSAGAPLADEGFSVSDVQLAAPSWRDSALVSMFIGRPRSQKPEPEVERLNGTSPLSDSEMQERSTISSRRRLGMVLSNHTGSERRALLDENGSPQAQSPTERESPSRSRWSAAMSATGALAGLVAMESPQTDEGTPTMAEQGRFADAKGGTPPHTVPTKHLPVPPVDSRRSSSAYSDNSGRSDHVARSGPPPVLDLSPRAQSPFWRGDTPQESRGLYDQMGLGLEGVTATPVSQAAPQRQETPFGARRREREASKESVIKHSPAPAPIRSFRPISVSAAGGESPSIETLSDHTSEEGDYMNARASSELFHDTGLLQGFPFHLASPMEELAIAASSSRLYNITHGHTASEETRTSFDTLGAPMPARTRQQNSSGSQGASSSSGGFSSEHGRLHQQDSSGSTQASIPRPSRAVDRILADIGHDGQASGSTGDQSMYTARQCSSTASNDVQERRSVTWATEDPFSDAREASRPPPVPPRRGSRVASSAYGGLAQ